MISAVVAALPRVKRQKLIPLAKLSPSTAYSACTMPAQTTAIRVARAIAATAPSTCGNLDNACRSRHRLAETASASHSAKPLADSSSPKVQWRLPSGARASTTTTSSARPSIAANRGRRHSSGIHGGVLAGAMAQAAPSRSCSQSPSAWISSAQTWWAIG